MTTRMSDEQRRAVERIMGMRVVDDFALEDRGHVFLVRVEDGRQVIVKGLRAEGKKRADGDGGFHREWAALEHLTAAGVPVPAFVGGDRDVPVLVQSLLPSGHSLADSLLGDDPARATAEVIAYATSLAKLNAVAPLSDERTWRLRAVDEGRGAFGDDGAVDEALAVLDAGRRGFVHGDACPDNMVLDDEGTCHLFDFEFSTGGPVALDAVYLVAPFPSCWCFAPLPDDVVAQALAAYRSVLPLGDRELDAAVVANAVGGLAMLERAHAKDMTWGLTTIRPRILRWLDVCARQPTFPAAARRADELVTRLRADWGDVTAPPHPAFAHL
jgi:Ser/Thr protein kinase RdoA (MazF antagonist)